MALGVFFTLTSPAYYLTLAKSNFLTMQHIAFKYYNIDLKSKYSQNTYLQSNQHFCHLKLFFFCHYPMDRLCKCIDFYFFQGGGRTIRGSFIARGEKSLDKIAQFHKQKDDRVGSGVKVEMLNKMSD